jgi:hypothetical protein
MIVCHIPTAFSISFAAEQIRWDRAGEQRFEETISNNSVVRDAAVSALPPWMFLCADGSTLISGVY